MSTITNKADLVEAMASAAEITQKQAAAALEGFLQGVTDALVEGGSVRLVGFGTFTTAFRDAREARVPGTDRTVQVAACTLPKFKAGKQFKDAVNKATAEA